MTLMSITAHFVCNAYVILLVYVLYQVRFNYEADVMKAFRNL